MTTEKANTEKKRINYNQSERQRQMPCCKDTKQSPIRKIFDNNVFYTQ
jgi:hypothetical protein